MTEVEVKLEAESQDQGPRPEPVLVFLAAPPSFLTGPGRPPVCWDQWLQTFEGYLAALGETHLSDSSKSLLLSNCLGREGRRVLSSLTGEDANYGAAVSALTDYFTGDAVEQAQILSFCGRAQLPGESAEQFVSALEQLAYDSGRPREELILDQLVARTNCPQLKERLRHRDALTLPAALHIARELEDAVPDPPRPRRARRGRPRRTCAVGEEELSGALPEVMDQLEGGGSGEGVRGSTCPVRTSHKVEQHMSPACPLTFSQSCHLARHLRSRHGSAPLICPGDPNVLSSQQEEMAQEPPKPDPCMGRTGEVKPGDPLLTPGKRRHSCPVCVDRHFKGENKLSRHMRTHTKEKPFSCPICFLKFSQSYHMTRHLKNQHHSLPVCLQCGSSFRSWQELKTHKKTHASLTCSICSQQFPLKSQLLSHLRVHRTARSSLQSLTCGDCGKVFGRLYHLKRHILSHRKAVDGERYDCLTCKRSFAFPDDLQKHAEVHVKEKNGTCPKCNVTFGSQEELESHMQVHHESHACNVCSRTFKVEYALRKHMQVHVDEPYLCALCSKRFVKMSHYKRHMQVHSRRELRCPHCQTVFLKNTALKCHLRTHTEERPHQCPCCVETFQQREQLEQHCLKHRRIKKQHPYSCTRCDKAFATLPQLTEHMASHDGDEPMSCAECGKTFLNKGKLEKHLSIHSGERPHLCSLCGNGFPSAASLRLHLHIHTGEKPFRCAHCDKSFKSASGLRLHGRRHMEAPPCYACLQCGRTYGRLTELKMHQRYHTGDKPHACSCCPKRFVSKNKLVVHMRSHTGERPYACPHCSATFTQTGDRNRHVHKYHGQPLSAGPA